MSTRILVVDDEADSASFVAGAIKGWGFEVEIASNGREGLSVLHTTLIDGILLDLEMPVMNGWTMLDELRWQGNAVPVIVMSKEENCAKLKKLLAEGAQDYLVKPFNHLLLMQKTFRHFPWQPSMGTGPALVKDETQEAKIPLEEGARLVQSGFWVSAGKSDWKVA
ncbi:MAG: response regulator [Nitrospirales bacterium]